MNLSFQPIVNNDKRELRTGSIQQAIDDCAAQGGGTITFTSGTYHTGTLRLRSRVRILLDSGATLVGSENLEDYPVLPVTHNEFGTIRSLLWAIDEEDIFIGGPGRIDFRGSSFMLMDQPDTRGPDGDTLHTLPESWQREAVVVAKDRPNQPIFLHQCQNIRIETIDLIDSPCWTISLSCCEDVYVTGLRVRNSLVVPNCDGVNISSSRNVIVDGCHFRCADDCVAIVGITNWDRPAENIVVSNCTMISRSCAVRIGHLASKVRNVSMHHLILSQGNRGIGIFAGDDGSVENVQADHLILNTHLYPGFWWGKGEPLVISSANGSGTIRGVRLSDVQAVCEGPIVIVGNGKQIKDVELDNWKLVLRGGEKRPTLGKWIDLQPQECRPLKHKQFPAFYIEGVTEISMDQIHIDDSDPRDAGFDTKPIRLPLPHSHVCR